MVDIILGEGSGRAGAWRYVRKVKRQRHGALLNGVCSHRSLCVISGSCPDVQPLVAATSADLASTYRFFFARLSVEYSSSQNHLNLGPSFNLRISHEYETLVGTMLRHAHVAETHEVIRLANHEAQFGRAELYTTSRNCQDVESLLTLGQLLRARAC